MTVPTKFWFKLLIFVVGLEGETFIEFAMVRDCPCI